LTALFSVGGGRISEETVFYAMIFGRKIEEIDLMIHRPLWDQCTEKELYF